MGLAFKLTMQEKVIKDFGKVLEALCKGQLIVFFEELLQEFALGEVELFDHGRNISRLIQVGQMERTDIQLIVRAIRFKVVLLSLDDLLRRCQIPCTQLFFVECLRPSHHLLKKRFFASVGALPRSETGVAD